MKIFNKEINLDIFKKKTNVDDSKEKVIEKEPKEKFSLDVLKKKFHLDVFKKKVKPEASKEKTSVSDSKKKINLNIFKKIDEMYEKIVFSRQDRDGTIFYFSPEDFSGLVCTEHSFKNKNGHKLAGYFYNYEDNIRPGRLVVFEHGMGTGHRAYMKEIVELCKHGYMVYSYDHTGCGESEGEGTLGLSGSLSDLDDCLNSLEREPSLRGVKISVVGHSWGGFSTMNILKYHPSLESVVSLSGFISVKDMQKTAIPFYMAPFAKNFYNVEKVANPGYAQSCAIDVLKNTDRPALIIHSFDDKVVPSKIHFLRAEYELSDKKNVEFMLVHGKRHNPNYTKEAVMYMDEFLADLKKKKKEGLLDTDEQKAEFIASYEWDRMTEQDSAVWNKIFEFLDR